MASRRSGLLGALDAERRAAGQPGRLDIEKSGTGLGWGGAWVWLILALFWTPVSADGLSVTLLGEEGELLMLAEGEAFVLAGAGPGEQGYYLFEVHQLEHEPTVPDDDGDGGGPDSEGSGSGGTDSEGSGSGGDGSPGDSLWGLAEILAGDDGLADLILYRMSDGVLEEFEVLTGVVL